MTNMQPNFTVEEENEALIIAIFTNRAQYFNFPGKVV